MRIVPRQLPSRPEDRGGKRTRVVDVLVIHTTEGGGSLDGVAHWWDRPDVVASAHYILDEHDCVQRVEEDGVAWHCGNRDVHERSIGIEVQGHAGDPKTWSVAMLQRLVALCADIIDRNPAIQVVHALPGIIGHVDVPCPGHRRVQGGPLVACPKTGGASHHWDPGPSFPWTAFLAALSEELAAECHEQRFPPGPPPGTKG